MFFQFHNSKTTLPDSYASAYLQVSEPKHNLQLGELYYRFGPLVHQWTMRYEAKHRYFKILANNIGNFINAPYTLAMRHQYLQCYLHLDSQHTSCNHPEFTKGIISDGTLAYYCLPIP